MERICPLLLDPNMYSPDTIDLLNNEEERHYWLPCLEGMVKKFVAKAGVLNPDKSNAIEEAEKCYQIFRSIISKIKSNPE